MKKWAKLLKSIVISLIIYMWFLGSSLLIRIDTESKLERLLHKKYQVQTELWEAEIDNLSQKLSSHCKINGTGTWELEDMRKLPSSGEKIQIGEEKSEKNIKLSTTENERKVKDSVTQARKWKTVRDNLIYIPELKQVWCLVPKAASTSWSHKIIESLPSLNPKLRRDLRNSTIPVQVSLRKHYGNVGTKILKHALDSKIITKILLVRHPLARIVSAFEDKLKNRKAKGDSMYFYGHYGVKINRSFRKNRRLNKIKEPTFAEFIDYLIEANPMDYDEHWKPISTLCGLCHINYDHIIRQEELGKTISFHLKKLGFLDFSNPKLGRHVELRDENKSRWQFESVNDYFRNISSDKLAKLVQKYEADFSLFDYTHPVFS